MKRAEWQTERWTKDPLPCWWIWWAGICSLPLWEDWCWGRGNHRVGRKSGGKRGCDEGPWAVGCSSCLLFEPILQILAWVNIWRGCLYQEAFPDLPISLLQRPYHSLSGFPKHTFFSEVLLKLVSDIQRFHQQIFNEYPWCLGISALTGSVHVLLFVCFVGVGGCLFLLTLVLTFLESGLITAKQDSLVKLL